jgi:hypothetical protein
MLPSYIQPAWDFSRAWRKQYEVLPAMDAKMLGDEEEGVEVRRTNGVDDGMMPSTSSADQADARGMGGLLHLTSRTICTISVSIAGVPGSGAGLYSGTACGDPHTAAGRPEAC